MSEGTTELARAKVNLTLHVGARIASGKWEGYHPVESLVVFADFGDVLTFQPVCGAAAQNIVVNKQIPIAAGLGGGTADAAAALRVFDSKHVICPTKIGADGPVCHLGVAVSTGAIFTSMDSAPRDAVPAMTSRQGDLLFRALSGSNDMQEAAIAQAPIIASVLRSLAQQPSCELARMSGSGATCFGIFRSDAQAQAAANHLAAAHPDWWVRACRLGDQPEDEAC